MPPRLSAIAKMQRRKPISKLQNQVHRAKIAFARDMINTMAKYPPKKPSSYKRTGRLGLGWTYRIPDVLSIEVTNAVPYAPRVQGPTEGPVRQAQQFKERGWQNITDEAAKVIERHEGLFAAAVGLIDD